MCAAVGDNGRPETVRETLNSTFGFSLEAIFRSLIGRHDPPSLVMFNIFKWTDFWLGSGAPVRFSQSCDPAFGDLAAFYRVSALSMRNALWHEVHAASARAAENELLPFRWQRWTTDGGRHLDLGRGDHMAAEMLLHWVRRVAISELPPVGAPLQQMRWLSEHRGAAAAALGGHASCFSFDDTFGGRIGQPHVVHANGWKKVNWVDGSAGRIRKHKPGYVASDLGARLLIDTRHAGQQTLSLGFLRTHNSTAAAEVECQLPCACARVTLYAFTPSHTATTQQSAPVVVTGKSTGTCSLALTLLTHGQPFKFININVESTKDGHGGDHGRGMWRDLPVLLS